MMILLQLYYYNHINKMKHAMFKIRAIPHKEKDASRETPNLASSSIKYSEETPTPKVNDTIDSLRMALLDSVLRGVKAPTAEARDRHVTVEAHKIGEGKIEEGSEEWRGVSAWMGEVCAQVLSAGFHLYVSGEMSYQQSKVYCCQGILRNLSQFVEVNTVSPQFYAGVDNLLKRMVLPYLGLKYPPSIVSGVNKRLNKLFKEVNNIQVITNDFFYNTDIEFEYRQSGEYNDLIMRVLNQIIAIADIPSKKNEEEESISNFQYFQEFMGNLFERVYDQQWMVGEGRKGELRQEIQTYKQKVKEYTHFLIGRKIPLSVPQYDQSEIDNGFVSIKSPTIFRIITKWCEQLWEKFENQNYYVDRTEGLMMLKGKQINILYPWLKKELKDKMKEQKIKIETYMREVQANNYEMQYSIMDAEQRLRQAPYINKYERISGKFSVKVVRNLENYIIVYLNRLIHGLMKISTEVFKKSMASMPSWPHPPNLLSFKVGDLLRCKCSSKEREIVRIFQEMQKISENSPEIMRIIRIKNRLSVGTNDILINVRFNNCVTAEVQLKVEAESAQSKFSLCSYNFSHLIYELQRSHFGPLSQMCSVWMNLDSKAKIYQRLIADDAPNNEYSIAENSCTKNFKEHTLESVGNNPFICSVCSSTYSNQNYVIPHQKCIKCKFWRCALCFIKQKEGNDIIDIILDEDIRSILIPTRCKILPTYSVGILIESRLRQVSYFQTVQFFQKKYLFKVGKDDTLQLVKELFTEKDIQSFLNAYLIFEVKSGQKAKYFPFIQQNEMLMGQILPAYVKKCYKHEKQTISLNSLKDYGSGEEKLVKILEGTKEQRKCVKFIEVSSNNITNAEFLSTDFVNLQFLNINLNSVKDLQPLTKFSRLQTIFALSNRLTTIPADLCNMQLKYISVAGNQITSLPAEIGNLVTLQVLRMNGNKVEQFPESFRKLQNLRELYANNNNIASIENVICSKLQHFELQMNQVSKIPKDFQKMVNLCYFNATRNKIIVIEAQFIHLKKLKIIFFDNNSINIFPNQLNQSSVVNLHLQRLFAPQLPQGITLPNLKQVRLSLGAIENITSFKMFENAQEIFLNINKLKGIPNDIDLLKQVKILDLSKNQITQLPQKIGEMGKLKQLNLMQNNLSIFPPNFFKLRLNILNLQNNQIAELPAEIGSMKTLTKLMINYNKVECLPSSLGNLHNLNTLSLSNNPLSVIPEEMNGLKKLATLKINGTKITVLPYLALTSYSQFVGYNLTSLPTAISAAILPRLQLVETLILTRNQLENIPDCIGQLVNLKYLRVGSNKLVSLGEGIFQLKNLIELSAPNNKLVSISDKFDRIPQLKTLNLEENLMTKLPSTISTLLNKKFQFFFKKNPLQQIPEFILTLLTHEQVEKILILTNFALTTFPQISNTQKLNQINLEGNKFQLFPAEINRCINATTISLANNVIVHFPPFLFNLTNLKSLRLNNNKIEEIPQQFGELPTLKELNLRSNPLKIIDKNVSKLHIQGLLIDISCLQDLSKSNSLPNINAKSLLFQGGSLSTVPQCIGELQNVQEIIFTNQSITALPETIGKLVFLKKLTISFCKNFELLSEGIGNLENLQQLTIVKTNIKDLPASFSRMKSLRVLDLQSSSLSALPEDFGQLQSLSHLDVSNNLLTALPNTLSSLSKLQKLIFKENKVTQLPTNIANCQSLQVLNAFKNNIRIVPEQLCKLSSIAQRSLLFGQNPIEEIGCIDFLLQKGDNATIEMAKKYKQKKKSAEQVQHDL